MITITIAYSFRPPFVVLGFAFLVSIFEHMKSIDPDGASAGGGLMVERRRKSRGRYKCGLCGAEDGHYSSTCANPSLTYMLQSPALQAVDAQLRSFSKIPESTRHALSMRGAFAQLQQFHEDDLEDTDGYQSEDGDYFHTRSAAAASQQSGSSSSSSFGL